MSREIGELTDKLERMEELILLLRRDIDKFRTDFFEVRNKINEMDKQNKN